MTTIAMLSAVSTVLMFLSFNVPLVPSFLKMDLSELPALLAAYALGPVSGVVVCFVKNLLNLPFSTTSGVGELSNFLLGAMFVLPAGWIYKRKKNRFRAFLGAIAGAMCMAGASFLTNYFIVYPMYMNFMPLESIMGMYQAINSHVETLAQALVLFNIPFTFIKGMLNVLLAFCIYKPLSPVLKGR